MELVVGFVMGVVVASGYGWAWNRLICRRLEEVERADREKAETISAMGAELYLYQMVEGSEPESEEGT